MKLKTGELRGIAKIGLGPNWQAELERLRQQKLLRSKSLITELIPAVREALASDKLGLVKGGCRYLSFIDPASFIRQARRAGVFRASKLDFRADNLIRLVDDLREHGQFLGFGADEQRYLDSIKALLSLAPDARDVHIAIVSVLRQRREVVIKSLLITVDQAFRPFRGTSCAFGAAAVIDPSRKDVFAAEDQASAMSLLVSMFQKVAGIEDKHNSQIDEDGILDGTYLRLLREAAKLNELMSAETYIDAYPYSAIRDGETVTVSSDDPRMEQSIRAGYVQTLMQLWVRGIFQADLTSSLTSSHIVSLSKLISDLHAKMGDQLVIRKARPIDRLVVQVPVIGQLEEALKDDRVFLEEAQLLYELEIESFADRKWIIDAMVHPKLRLLDLIKMKRWLAILSGLYFQTLDNYPSWTEGERLDMRSRIPIFDRATLSANLSVILGEEKARVVLEEMTYDPRSGQYYDAQYQPMVRLGNYVALPLGIFMASNTVRNFLCNRNARLLPADGVDPMQKEMEQSLKARGFDVKTNIKSKHRGKELEVDLLAVKDDTILLWECKNAFHPCDAQEMRTSYDHLLKAGRQLDRSLGWMRDSAVRNSIFKSWGWPSIPDPKIVTCIVTANRIFSGYSINGHPVRQAFEMANMLKRGWVNLQGTKRRVWASSEFVVEDLLAYIRGETIIADLYGSMVDMRVVHSIGAKRLIFQSYGVDLARLAEIQHERYPTLDQGDGGS